MNRGWAEKNKQMQALLKKATLKEGIAELLSLRKLLMDEMLRDLIKRGVKKVYLEVDAENQQAISLYEKLNFEKIDKRTNYYSNGHNAIVYVLNL